MKTFPGTAFLAAVCLIACTTFTFAQESQSSESNDSMTSCLSKLLEDSSSKDKAAECIEQLVRKTGSGQGGIDPNASYALGVRFQREVASNYEALDYTQFLLGSLEQAIGKTRFSDQQLNRTLEQELLSIREKSEKFLLDFARQSNVVDWKGIYYIDRTGQYGLHLAGSNENGSKDPTDTAGASESTARDDVADPTSENSDCPSDDEKNGRQLVIEFKRLGFKEQLPAEFQDVRCIAVDEDEIIRGWRTALRKMNKNEVWELVVPPALAYGEAGAAGSGDDNENTKVEPGEALRFLIRLRKKNLK